MLRTAIDITTTEITARDLVHRTRARVDSMCDSMIKGYDRRRRNGATANTQPRVSMTENKD